MGNSAVKISDTNKSRLPDNIDLSPIEKLKRYYGVCFVLDNYEQACDAEYSYKLKALSAKDYVKKVLAIEGMLQSVFAVRIHELLKMGELPEQIIGKMRYPKFIEGFIPVLKLLFGRGIVKIIYEEFWFLDYKKAKCHKK